jgi:hypothetical protein
VLVPRAKKRAEPDLLQRSERLGDDHARHQLPPRRGRERLRADGAARGQVRGAAGTVGCQLLRWWRWQRGLRVRCRARFEVFDAQRVERAVIVHHRCPHVDGDREELGPVAQMRDEQVFAREKDAEVKPAKFRKWLERRRVRGL